MAYALPPSITLALQGGGAHGAFAWGTLDRLLAEERLRIEAITATSGGALVAAVLAQGMQRGGPKAARQQLEALWKKVSVAAGMLPFRTTLMDKLMSNVGLDLSPSSIALDYLTKLFSPYQFNMFDLNPLRAIVAEIIDFEALRRYDDIALYINTTHAQTGESRVFHNSEVTLDVLMASCCLPYLFKTVMIDGEPYWDGGFSGNPALYPLLSEKTPRDVLLIATVPFKVEEVPTKAVDILDRTTELSFHSALLQELRLVESHNASHPKAALTLHTIEAGEIINGLGHASKLNGDWDFLVYLHDLGAQAAEDFLKNYPA
ncbi:MAG: patatin-like phospholipase family protein [Alphaproteobacteria bacterium]|nr:patatin-like phospholipase family protein [Alphaproteobacteria bacterium]